MFSLATLLLCGVAVTSCQSEDVLLEEVENDAKVIVIVPDKELEDANAMTRSVLSFDTKSSMKYGWEQNDKVGVFNVALPDNEVGDNIQFQFKPKTQNVIENGLSARFNNDNYSFSTDYYWVAYAPYTFHPLDKKVTAFDNLPITYKGQRQYSSPVPNGQHPNTDQGYSLESEAMASKYLSEYDYMISNATQPDETGFTTFTFSHVGSTIRFFLQFPADAFGGNGKSAQVTSMSVLSKGSNLVSDVELAILPYSADNTSTYREKSKTTTNKLDLTCTGEDGKGISVPDNGYLITYMEFYPSVIPNEDCLLYVTAIVDGVEKHYRSEPLPAKTIVAGKLYQWKPTEWDTPIELTATLATWQEVLASPIDINLEN